MWNATEICFKVSILTVLSKLSCLDLKQEYF